MIGDQNFYDICLRFFLSYGFGYSLRPKAEVCQGRTFGYGRRWKLRLRSNTAVSSIREEGREGDFKDCSFFMSVWAIKNKLEIYDTFLHNYARTLWKRIDFW